MKYFLTFLIACVFLNGFSQNNVYMITEKFDGTIGFLPSFDSVFVTTPVELPRHIQFRIISAIRRPTTHNSI